MIASRAGARNMEDEAEVSSHARMQLLQTNQSTDKLTWEYIKVAEEPNESSKAKGETF